MSEGNGSGIRSTCRLGNTERESSVILSGVESPDETDDMAASPATPLPEESVGSEDASAQKKAVLADSAERSEDLEAAPGSFVEHRTSDEATEPST